MSLLSEELKKIIGVRKNAAPELVVSEQAISGWFKGTLPKEANLAKIVEKLSDSEDKQGELLRLFALLWRERIDAKTENHEQDAWTPESRKLAVGALDRVAQIAARPVRRPRIEGRTLLDFPEAFYPLAIITGDKSEVSDNRINPADFGAVNASQSELRWLAQLGLRRD